MVTHGSLSFKEQFFQEHQKQMLNSLPSIANALFCFYGVLSLVHPFFVPPPNQWPMSIISGISAAFYIPISLYIKRRNKLLSKQNIVIVVFLMTLLATINTFSHIILTRDVLQTTNVLFIYIVLSLVGISYRLFITILAVLNTLWLWVIWFFDMMSDPAFIHFIFTMAIGSFITTLLAVIRYNMLRYSVIEILRRKKVESKLEKIANKDPLTGLSNRRSYDIFLKENWHEMALQKTPLSLIIADVDHFKKINDAYGHHFGDEVLVVVGETLEQCVRSSTDLIARYGGEEFIAIMPNMPAPQTQQLAERMRKKVADLDVDNRNITISLGSATMIPDDTTDCDVLFKKADQALYEAKSNGRDRAVHSQ